MATLFNEIEPIPLQNKILLRDRNVLNIFKSANEKVRSNLVQYCPKRTDFAVLVNKGLLRS